MLAAGGVAAANFEAGDDWVPPHAAKREIHKMTKIDFGEPAIGPGVCLPVSWFVAFRCFSIGASR